jgi:iron complex transport system permease protein
MENQKLQEAKSNNFRRDRIKRSTLLMAYTFILLVVGFLLALSLGPAQNSLINLFSENYEERRIAFDIIFHVRLPRIILAILAGSSLGAAGVAFQAILRNPLADPYILGVSGGALFGTVLFSILGSFSAGFLSFGRPMAAFIGASFTLALLIYLSSLGGRLSSTSLILLGVIINFFFTALILFLLTFTEFSKLQGSLFWIAGSIGSPDYFSLIFISIFLVAGLVILTVLSGQLNILSLGESTAFSLGVNLESVKLLTIISASLMTAAAVSYAGLIGFVGLMIPHIFRLITGPDNRYLVLSSALGGSLFLLICDTLGRTLLTPLEIPAGLITALAGCPFFIWLFLKEKGEKIEID